VCMHPCRLAGLALAPPHPSAAFSVCLNARVSVNWVWNPCDTRPRKCMRQRSTVVSFQKPALLL
jgi:hypothetical protein